MEDEEIISLYFDRNEDAIAASDKKYGRYCYSIADHIVFDRFEAEQCVSDTWLAAWNAIPPERPVFLKAWFARVTRNLAINVFNRNKSKKQGSRYETVLNEMSEAISHETPEENLNLSVLADCINRFLVSLSKRERMIFVRRIFFCETSEEISARYGISTSAVYTSLSRSRRKLKSYLKSEGFNV